MPRLKAGNRLGGKTEALALTTAGVFFNFTVIG
jgi:hypothetical protein